MMQIAWQGNININYKESCSLCIQPRLSKDYQYGHHCLGSLMNNPSACIMLSINFNFALCSSYLPKIFTITSSLSKYSFTSTGIVPCNVLTTSMWTQLMVPKLNRLFCLHSCFPNVCISYFNLILDIICDRWNLYLKHLRNSDQEFL